MDLLPPQKFAVRQWRFGRKRRRSGTEGAESEGNFILLAQYLIYYHMRNNKTNLPKCIFRLFSTGDSKIVKKDGENTSMETAPAEPLANAAPITAEAGANGN